MGTTGATFKGRSEAGNFVGVVTGSKQRSSRGQEEVDVKPVFRGRAMLKSHHPQVATAVGGGVSNTSSIHKTGSRVVTSSASPLSYLALR
jgi:hypothetical protein